MKKLFAVLLLAALTVGLVSCSGPISYPNSELYHAGNAEIEDEVTSLDLHWPAGRLSVTVGTGDTLTLTETSSQLYSPEKQVHWLVDNGTLHVYYSAPGEFFGFISFGKYTTSKELAVVLPAGSVLNETNIETASAEVAVDGVVTKSLSVSTASGDLSGSASVSEKIELDSASGDLVFENKTDVGNVKCNTASGRIQLTLLSAEKVAAGSASGKIALTALDVGTVELGSASGKLDANVRSFGNAEFDTSSGAVDVKVRSFASAEFDTASGAVSVSVPETLGFTAHVDTASGDFSSEVPLAVSGNYHTAGDGSAKLDIETASGDIEILKLK